jgi:hypothetical protein
MAENTGQPPDSNQLPPQRPEDANGASSQGKPEASKDAQPANNGADGVPTGPDQDFIEQLKQGIEKTRLPPDLRDEILAQQPPLEEQERLYRELMEQGGLSSEEFFASLGLELEPPP